jgi:long-chain acyl-CoA synthetase
MGLHDFTFYDLVNRNAACFSQKDAWYEVQDGRTLTYLQFKEKVDKLASGLQKDGLKKGERVAIVGKNCLEYFLVFGAAAALGAIVVPVNWRLSADEMAFNLSDCEPSRLFVGAEFQKVVNGIAEKFPSVNKYYSLAHGQGDFLDFRSLLATQDDFRKENVSKDDGFVMIHTAAIEGRPRGALLSHNNILMGNMQFLYLFGLTQHDVHLNVLPLFHAGGLFMVTTAFHGGALNINDSGFDVARTLKLIEEKKVSIMMEFTPMLSSMLQACEKGGGDIRSLKSVAGIESPETIEKYQRMTGGQFYCLYGQTETSCVATYTVYDERPGSTGRPIPMAEVKVVDDYDRPLPCDRVGEIVVKGPMIFKGYWNLTEETAYTFREGWHHTGDLGRFDQDGFLWYAGRKPEKELIKPGGENVYPAEVEKVILQHPAVEQVVVFGVPDPKWKEGIKAVCRLKEGHELDSKALIDFVGGRIARYKKPQYVEFISHFPLLEDGSPNREAIKEQYGGSQG